MKNRQMAVIGAGLMGHGIALTLARAGQYVAITDPAAEARATVSQRIGDSLKLLGTPAGDIARILKRDRDLRERPGRGSKAAFVFEAAPEKLELKQALFAEIEAAAPRTRSSPPTPR